MLFNDSVLMPTTDIPAAVDTFARDTVEAAAMLRQMGVQKVALVGGSVAGLSALRAGLDAEARDDGIVCLSGSGSTEITDSLAGLQVPVLSVAPLMTSQPSRLTDELYGAATSAKSRKLHADMLLQPGCPNEVTGGDGDSGLARGAVASA
jgi:pimeloyl-ACP methyl ester carboxylesterase